MRHHDCKLEKTMIPHCLHLAIGVATLVVSAKVLCKLHHLHKALKEYRKGKEELEEESPVLAALAERAEKEEKKKK